MSNKIISYILPVFNEEEGIEVFCQQLTETISNSKFSKKYDFEFLFINDGSVDRTLEIIQNFKSNLPKDDVNFDIRIVNFSRNFGHEAAIKAGLDFTKGDATIIMDTDLQDPPDVSLELIEVWEQGAKIVSARRLTRRDSFFKKLTASAFYKIFAHMTGSKLQENVGNFRLIDSQLVKILKNYSEHNRFFRAMVADLGFRHEILDFERKGRYAGKTHYPYRKMFSLATDGILGYSNKPLKIATKLGFLICLLDIIFVIYIFLGNFISLPVASNINLPGWATQIVILSFFSGIQLLFLGVIGSYIGRIFFEIKNRPIYIVSDVFEDQS